MPISKEFKSRWLSEKETESLSQIIHNFFTKSANIIVDLRNNNKYQSPNTDSNNIYLKDLDRNVINSNNGDHINNHNHNKNNFAIEFQDDSKDIYNNQTLFELQNDKIYDKEGPFQNYNVNSEFNTDSWFNIRTDDTVIPKTQLTVWNTKDITELPPMIVETVLDFSNLNRKMSLYLDDQIIEPKGKTEIVLERWLINLDLDKYDNDVTDLPAIYKNLVIMFRCLYTMVGLLPSSQLMKQITNSELQIKTKILNGLKPITSKGRFGLSRALIHKKPELDVVESKDLLPIITPIGSLNLSVSYRKNCNIHLGNSVQASLYSTPLDTNKNSIKKIVSTGTTPEPKQIPKSEGDNINIEELASLSMADTNPKFRASSTSINSQSSKRRLSNRSVSIFKSGSIAFSSSSPPVNVLHALQNNGISPQSYSLSNPIPVRRDDSTSSIHFYQNNSSDRNDQANIRFPSSVGSKIKNSTSRNNSLEGQMIAGSSFTPSSNPMLQNFKSKTKFFVSSISNMDSNNSIYLDDDLNNFMRLLDSKPDLRVSSNSSIVYEDSLTNFKTLRKNNDLLSDSPLKESLVFSRSNSPSSISPSKPPPLVTLNEKQQSIINPSIKEIQDINDLNITSRNNLVDGDNNKIEYSNSVPIKYTQSLSGQSNYFGSSGRTSNYESSLGGRIPVGSYDSSRNSSRRVRNSRSSQESRGIIHAPLITSSYSPNSLSGTPSQLNSQSVHSILKASAISSTSGAVATGINSTIDSNLAKNISDSTYNNVEKDYLLGKAPSSVPKNMYSVEMDKGSSSIGRAHSSLRSISISAGGLGFIGDNDSGHSKTKSRSGSANSMVSSAHLRNLLNNSLKYDGLSVLSNERKDKHRQGNMTPDQLKDISYGQEVFHSDDDEEEDERDKGGNGSGDNHSKLKHIGENMKVDHKKGAQDNLMGNALDSKEHITKTPQTEDRNEKRKRSRGSIGNIINNLKNMQRRQSQIGTNAGSNNRNDYNYLRLGGVGPSHQVTLHTDDEYDEDEDENDEDDEDLLFEMSDMTPFKG